MINKRTRTVSAKRQHDLDLDLEERAAATQRLRTLLDSQKDGPRTFDPRPRTHAKQPRRVREADSMADDDDDIYDGGEGTSEPARAKGSVGVQGESQSQVRSGTNTGTGSIWDMMQDAERVAQQLDRRQQRRRARGGRSRNISRNSTTRWPSLDDSSSRSVSTSVSASSDDFGSDTDADSGRDSATASRPIQHLQRGHHRSRNYDSASGSDPVHVEATDDLTEEDDEGADIKASPSTSAKAQERSKSRLTHVELRNLVEAHRARVETIKAEQDKTREIKRATRLGGLSVSPSPSPSPRKRAREEAPSLVGTLDALPEQQFKLKASPSSSSSPSLSSSTSAQDRLRPFQSRVPPLPSPSKSPSKLFAGLRLNSSPLKLRHEDSAQRVPTSMGSHTPLLSAFETTLSSNCKSLTRSRAATGVAADAALPPDGPSASCSPHKKPALSPSKPLETTLFTQHTDRNATTKDLSPSASAFDNLFAHLDLPPFLAAFHAEKNRLAGVNGRRTRDLERSARTLRQQISWIRETAKSMHENRQRAQKPDDTGGMHDSSAAGEDASEGEVWRCVARELARFVMLRRQCGTTRTSRNDAQLRKADEWWELNLCMLEQEEALSLRFVSGEGGSEQWNRALDRFLPRVETAGERAGAIGRDQDKEPTVTEWYTFVTHWRLCGGGSGGTRDNGKTCADMDLDVGSHPRARARNSSHRHTDALLPDAQHQTRGPVDNLDLDLDLDLNVKARRRRKSCRYARALWAFYSYRDSVSPVVRVHSKRASLPTSTSSSTSTLTIRSPATPTTTTAGAFTPQKPDAQSDMETVDMPRVPLPTVFDFAADADDDADESVRAEWDGFARFWNAVARVKEGERRKERAEEGWTGGRERGESCMST